MSSKKRSDSVQDSNYQCFYCKDSNVKEELLALIDPKFEGSIVGSDYNDLNFKITDFIIHDQNGLCSLDQGLIENGKEIFICGCLSSICDDHQEIKSIAVKMIGPLNEWWFSGFDGSTNLLVGIESPYSSYLLQNPNVTYEGIFKKLHSKMFLTKFIIEILQQNPQIDFDILLSILKNKSEQQKFDRQYLISNIDFLIDHIQNYDSFSDSDEIRLSETKVFKTLQKLSNKSINSSRNNKNIENFQDFGINDVNTENSKKLFNQILHNILDDSENNSFQTDFSINRPSNNIDDDMGQFVKFQLNGRFCIGRIISKSQNLSSSSLYHVNLFILDKDTLLRETSSKQILFATEKCMDIDISTSNIEVIDVKLQKSFNFEKKETNHLICFQIYDDKHCIFQSLPSNYLNSESPVVCLGCLKLKQETIVQSYSIGDCVLISSRHLNMTVKNYFANENQIDNTNYESYDPTIYTEKFRKSHYKTLMKDNYELEDLNLGYNVGYIEEIIIKENNQKYLKLNLFYRPENIFDNYEDFLKCDLNLLFWSDSIVQIDTSLVFRKCKVIYSETAPKCFLNQEDFFYFNQCYANHSREFSKPSEKIISKFKDNDFIDMKYEKNLTILDLFSGCGGLSYGFASLVASKLYAIEKDKSAAQSYKKNYPNCTIYNADANIILKMLIEHKDEFLISKLPSLNSIDMIISGPPCQGFSEMNRFSLSEYSLFKRSFVGCFLNYLDLFKPKYFLFENVNNMIHYGKSFIFKTVCSFMIYSDYQIRIAILQAGCYGLPQNRKRLFIIGAKNGLELPQFPFPNYLFARNKSKTSFKIDGIKFDPFEYHFIDKGLFRMITIQDAIGDLIELNQENYYMDIPRPYKTEHAENNYQKLLKNTHINPMVNDHYCKIMSQLNIERIKRIPLEVGSDWRDLPNLEVKLNNGQLIKKLKYSKNSNKDDNKNTLIPRCLVHTANKNNNWNGVYGRLSWKGYFPTIVTDPDPITAQGKIIHPQQHRIISIREMARAQGFTDDFILFGNETEKYSQVGNAVPPILSWKLARKFIQSINHQ